MSTVPPAPRTLGPGVYLGRRERARALGALALSQESYAPGQRIAVHAHREPYLCLVIEGAFRERSAERELALAPGDVVFHPAGEPHADEFADLPALCLDVELGRTLEEHDELLPAREGPALRAPAGAAGDLVWRLHREFHACDDASELAIEGLTLELLALFARRRRAEGARPPRWLAATLERLRGLPADSPSLAALAREAGGHPSTLARAFRRFQGCTVAEFLRGQRLGRACAARERPPAGGGGRARRLRRPEPPDARAARGRGPDAGALPAPAPRIAPARRAPPVPAGPARSRRGTARRLGLAA